MNWNKRRNTRPLFFFLLVTAALILGSFPQVRSYLKKILQEKSIPLLEMIQGANKYAHSNSGRDAFSIRLDQDSQYDTMQSEQSYSILNQNNYKV
ncbi:hypothetical protein [Thermoactinomyces mirandus]|uniref:Uncharacterized protein n=1 Tax=Thermoactinomyces mirandus TaxID=2756294 RepID=A0A7W1XUJ3_9BACL|nr:hypothetical protein [Thermoactinomyces mirandus]MBA4603558.1 hypothetical protein [Thermoactinomyces mirandus]